MQEELNRLIRSLSKDSDELYLRPGTPQENQGNVIDGHMLTGFCLLLMYARDHKMDINENTLAAIDWIRMMTMQGKLGELISENS